jgi:hypothetical protein
VRLEEVFCDSEVGEAVLEEAIVWMVNRDLCHEEEYSVVMTNYYFLVHYPCIQFFFCTSPVAALSWPIAIFGLCCWGAILAKGFEEELKALLQAIYLQNPRSQAPAPEDYFALDE